MRLKYQLFMALLFASALLILLMYIISSWSFSRGLLGYVNQSLAQNARQIVEQLEPIYEQRQSWAWARGASPEWRSLTRLRKRDDAGAPSRGKRGPPYVLADEAKRIIVGPPNIDSDTRWLEINGQSGVVGYLGYRKLARLDSELDRVFENQQKKSFAYGGLGMVLLSALLAAPLASFLLKPLLRIGDAVEHIRRGEYQHRVFLQRRDELGTLAEDINQLAHTLENNREARQRWVAEISHELRTPLAVLRGELEAMQDGIRPMTQEGVDSLHAEIIGLNRLVDDLHTLSLSDVGALDYRFETLLPDTFLEDFFNKNRSSLADNSLTLTTYLKADGLSINADQQRLQQLFSNLLQNSLRYTDSGGTLVIETHRIDDSKLQVLWSDSSPGVPADALGRLFDPLYRVEQSRNRASGGAGLGLSIVSRIVQAHNGTISADHSAYGGLQLDIRFPLA